MASRIYFSPSSSCFAAKQMPARVLSELPILLLSPAFLLISRHPHGTWVPTGIAIVGADVPHKQGFYNLQGVKMQGSLAELPAGIYIVNGRKVVKK